MRTFFTTLVLLRDKNTVMNKLLFIFAAYQGFLNGKQQWWKTKFVLTQQAQHILMPYQVITVAVWTLKPFTPLLTRPQGSQGCQKIRFFLQIKVLSSCAKIAQKRHKLQKLSKLKKNCQKNPVFLDIFEYSSI